MDAGNSMEMIAPFVMTPVHNANAPVPVQDIHAHNVDVSQQSQASVLLETPAEAPTPPTQ